MQEVKESMKPPIQLLQEVTRLKGENFIPVDSADDEMKDFWEVLLLIDDTVQQSDSAKSILSSRPKLKEFFDHCCQLRHYSFCIKICGKESCKICLPLRMDATVFSALRFLPDPLLGEDGHYLPFSEVHERSTTERDRPSLDSKEAKITFIQSLKATCY